MKLQRLRLSQIRQFRGALEIPDFAPGLNVFHGPNEAGKSTIVRAIRAAYFERYRSGVIDDLIPRGETSSSCSPTIELAFTAQGRSHALVKTFFARKRCTLTSDGQALDGEAAEEAMARLLGFAYAQKGASKAEHWGIPGLLWIQQGDGQELVEPVANAADHLRTALESTVGAVASTAGDDVLARLRARRDEILTPGTGRPRGAFAEAKRGLDELGPQIAALDVQIESYQADVDRLSQLRALQAAEAASKPWDSFRRQMDQARQDLAAAEQLQSRLAQHQQSEATLGTTVQLLAEQSKAYADQRDAALRRRAELDAAASARETAAATAATQAARKVQAAREVDEAAAWVARAETEEMRRTLTQRLADASAQEQRLLEVVSQAGRQAEQLAQHLAVADANQLDPTLLRQLDTRVATLREREITQRAAATTLSFSLQADVVARLDGQPVAAGSEHRITTAAEIDIAGVGRIGIVPGDSDVAELAREVDAARLALAAMLGKLGVATVDEARRRHDRHQAAAAEAHTARQLLAMSAPDGLDKLRAALAAATSAKDMARQQLDGLPAAPATTASATSSAPAPAPASVPTPGLAEARAAHRRALDAQQQAAARHLEAAQALGSAQARELAAGAELAKVRALLDDPQTAQRERHAQGQLAQAHTQLEQTRLATAELQELIRQTQPALLKQDVERLQASMTQSLAAFNQRATQIGTLEGGLEKAGASGLEGERAELGVRLNALLRRHGELALRASALDLLIERLEDKRQALTRRLQAPLQARLDHYLRILFPTARLALNEDLTPGDLARGTGSPADTVSFRQLSFGAREQTALISRLAYADLLKEAGQPTLLILDDALVHSDPVRLAQMKRVLYDAATRHQVLLFTCHAERWEGLGAVPRDVRSFVVPV